MSISGVPIRSLFDFLLMTTVIDLLSSLAWGRDLLASVDVFKWSVRKTWTSVIVQKRALFSLRPHSHVTVLANLDVNDVRAAAHGAVLDVLLFRTGWQVDGQNDLLAARVANVAGLVVHLLPSHAERGYCFLAWL
jgi:hypothetical protein